MWDDKVGILDVKAKIDNKRNRKIYYKVEHQRGRLWKCNLDRSYRNLYNRIA